MTTGGPIILGSDRAILTGPLKERAFADGQVILCLKAGK